MFCQGAHAHALFELRQLRGVVDAAESLQDLEQRLMAMAPEMSLDDAQLAKLHKQMSENADDPVTSSLRAAARDLGVSHETVRTRMNKGVAALQQAAAEAARLLGYDDRTAQRRAAARLRAGDQAVQRVGRQYAAPLDWWAAILAIPSKTKPIRVRPRPD